MRLQALVLGAFVSFVFAGPVVDNESIGFEEPVYLDYPGRTEAEILLDSTISAAELAELNAAADEAAKSGKSNRRKRRRPRPIFSSTSKRRDPPKPLTAAHRLAITRPSLWKPEVAAKFQIILTGTIDTTAKLTPENTSIFDIDMFLTPKSTFDDLKSQNKKIICYFSAGSSEDWRDDNYRFSRQDMGKRVEKDDGGKVFWDGEKWLDIKNPTPSSRRLPNVWQVMRDRIRFAAEQGCDAIDPDNVDGYQNNNGLRLTKKDSINFIKFMSEEARQFNMTMGLKNSMDIIPSVQSYVDFAVNEECAVMQECVQYQNFVRTKPVFHIEYTSTKNPLSSGDAQQQKTEPKAKSKGSASSRNAKSSNAPKVGLGTFCSFRSTPEWGAKFSTVIKVEALDGWVQFCDGKTSFTRLVEELVANTLGRGKTSKRITDEKVLLSR